MKDCLIKWSIRLLISVVAAVLIIAVIAAGLSFFNINFPGFAPLLPAIPAIAVSSCVLIAILTFARDRERLAREREENRSKIFLEQAKAGLDEVLELLKDKNNKRVVWVRAARVLLEATSLGAQIKAPEYVKAYRLYEDKIRSELYRVLTIYNEETQEREGLPPQFFYGIKDWNRNISLDEAACEASAKVRVSDVSINQVVPEPVLQPLPVKAVVAVFNFLDYRSDYSDPLPNVRVWEGNWEGSFGPSQGARRYVAHAESTTAVAGKIHRRQKSG